jgi:hypothetical protein
VWLGFFWELVSLSPKVQEKVGVPVQFEGVAEAEKFIVRGAAPDEGVAAAVQERAQIVDETVMVPAFVQGTSSVVTVIVHAYIPDEANVWLGFCSVEVPPSPKAQEKVGAPMQFDGVAVATKATASGAMPEDGMADASQVSQHGDAETVMVPVQVQVLPSAVAIMVQA